MHKKWAAALGALLSVGLPSEMAFAAEAEVLPVRDFTLTFWGLFAVLIFAIAYFFVVREEKTHLKKSIPVLVAAGIIWITTALAYQSVGDFDSAGLEFKHAALEFGFLLLFLLAAMTYVNTLQERNVFEVIRYKLLGYGFTQPILFWVLGVSAFFLSPVLDNLTTALVMCSVAIAVSGGSLRFVALSAINIVVAANAGGAFSPFGDITTLMVWQSGHVEFFEFFSIFLPALAIWLVPAFAMSFAVRASDVVVENVPVRLKEGAWIIMGLFLLTIVLAVTFYQVLHLPSAAGMMTGLGFLKLYGYVLSRREHRLAEASSKEGGPIHAYDYLQSLLSRLLAQNSEPGKEPSVPSELSEEITTAFNKNFKPRHKPFDTFVSVKRVEFDTLLFFYGVIMCVAGLGQLGYLAVLSELAYEGVGPTWTNIAVGLLSAIVDNIPVMYAVLQMSPEMSHGQWMLVTLTAGTGGSLLSVGSAAGVALMGFAKVKNREGKMVDAYTFSAHLKWTPAIFLGYCAGIVVHILLHPDVAWPTF